MIPRQQQQEHMHDGNLCNKSRSLFGRYGCIWSVAQYTPHHSMSYFTLKLPRSASAFSRLSFLFSFTTPCLKDIIFNNTQNPINTLNIPATTLMTHLHTLVPRLLPAATV